MNFDSLLAKALDWNIFSCLCHYRVFKLWTTAFSWEICKGN